MKKFSEFANESNSFSLEEIRDKQSVGAMSSDFIFNSSPADLFSIETVKVKDLKIDGKPVPTLNFYRRNSMDEDVSIVNKLIRRYENGDKINPIVVSEKDDIMDGIHRTVMYKELKLKEVLAYKRITK